MMYRPTKSELRAFKEAHSLTNQQIAGICLCSKRTVESWMNLKDDKREIPVLAWEKLQHTIDVGRTIIVVRDALEAFNLPKTFYGDIGAMIHEGLYND